MISAPDDTMIWDSISCYWPFKKGTSLDLLTKVERHKHVYTNNDKTKISLYLNLIWRTCISKSHTNSVVHLVFGQLSWQPTLVLNLYKCHTQRTGCRRGYPKPSRSHNHINNNNNKTKRKTLMVGRSRHKITNSSEIDDVNGNHDYADEVGEYDDYDYNDETTKMTTMGWLYRS